MKTHDDSAASFGKVQYWIAAILAPVAGLGITGGLFGLVSGLLAGSPVGGLIGGVVALCVGGALGVVMGWPLMVAAGLPVGYLITTRFKRQAAYLLPGAFALMGVAAAMSLVVTMAQTDPAEYLRMRMGQFPTNFYASIPWGALAGGLTGWLFGFMKR